MPTPKSAPYKERQRAATDAARPRFHNVKSYISQAVKGDAGAPLPPKIVRADPGPKTIAGREYVVDSLTGQMWRADKWRAREQKRRARRARGGNGDP